MKTKCKKCLEKHHVSICNKEKESEVISPGLHTKNGGNIAIQTAQAVISTDSGKARVRCRVLFDSGSQRPFIRSTIIELLGGKSFEKQCLTLSGFGQEEPKQKCYNIHEIEVKPLKGNNSVKMKATEVPIKLWDLEAIGIEEEDPVYESLIDDISFYGERYKVKLPCKEKDAYIPSNYNKAIERLKGQFRKLKRNPEVLIEDDRVLKKHEKEGIVENVPKEEIYKDTIRAHYLPHQAVVRQGAETTKARIVYDVSVKKSKSSLTLNESLHIGPPLMPLMYDVLLRLRCYNTALIDDIQKTQNRMAERGFLMRKWKSNESRLEKMIENDKRQQGSLNEKSTNAENGKTKELADRLEKVVSTSEKVLGKQWNKLDKKLQLDTETLAENIEGAEKATKRSVLSAIANMYDCRKFYIGSSQDARKNNNFNLLLTSSHTEETSKQHCERSDHVLFNKNIMGYLTSQRILTKNSLPTPYS